MAEKQSVNPYLLAAQVIAPSPANLLATVDEGGKPNVMTISWGFVGEMWHKPVFIAAVRPSRYTYRLLEKIPEFTVNTAYPQMQTTLDLCGTRSGRDVDKFQQCGLTPLPSQTVRPPAIAECAICYECKVIHTASAEPESEHKLYFGEILACRADQAVIAGLQLTEFPLKAH